jgi:GH15 family glucan-1,4-alpha-glucosidase
LDLVTRLARKAIEVAGQPDAGIWEYRSEWRPQTFSSLMCWAAADRMGRIAEQHRPELQGEFRQAANRIQTELLQKAIHPQRGYLVADYGGTELDAALLQAVTLRFLPYEDPRLHTTVDAIRSELDHHGWTKRYRINDGFGVPEVAFMLCMFWQVEALAALGRTKEARSLMDRLHDAKAPLGLLSEDLDPTSGMMWGNFPQAYSHTGLIHAAFAASPRWSEYGI